MTVKADVGALLREAQQKRNCEEIEIYKSIFSAVDAGLNSIQNIIPIHLPPCNIELAQSIAKSMGFQIIQGVTGYNYLGWAKTRSADDIYADAK